MGKGVNGANGAASNGRAHVAGDEPLVHRMKPDRKQSSPMAPAFMVSAPAKVIVFGEHSVVHGKASLGILPSRMQPVQDHVC
jgi:mevalonate kinase